MAALEPDCAILLTAPGAAAIAVVRITGRRVRAFLQEHFSKLSPAPGRCVHGELRDGDRVLDDPLVVVGADSMWADLNVHAGPWVVRSVLDLLASEGFEVIENLGAPLPAASVDAADEISKEVLQYLPSARTEPALRILLSQPDAWKRIDEHEPATILADRSMHWMLNPPRVAIVGVPNGGKSTLANQLFGQERSITADLPGTTRDWVGEVANIDGLAVMLVDTPGLRATTDAIEGVAIERAAHQVSTADLVLLVLDVTQPLAPAQVELMDRFPNALLVLNKTDVSAAWRLESTAALTIVARTGGGVPALRNRIRDRFQCRDLDFSTPRVWTQRQRGFLLHLQHRPPAQAR